ncbi:MAG: hypothetical protein CMJ83_07545 [Planctomycetes bacterium]|nr:hypothetical protein [Planctomycetota bacterium]
MFSTVSRTATRNTVNPGIRRVMVLDPIGHVLGSHDHAICSELAGLGCEVRLGTHPENPFGRDSSPYRRQDTWRGVVGTRSRVMKTLSWFRALGRIMGEVRSWRPDVVFLYYSLQPGLDRLLLRRLAAANVRTILAVHDVTPLDAAPSTDAAWRRLYHTPDRIMAFSEFSRREIIERMGVDSDRVGVAYLGVANVESPGMDIRSARRRVGASEQEELVLCFGQIKSNKGLDHLIEGFASVAAERPRAHLRVVGLPRIDMTRFHEMVAALGLDDRVTFLSERVPEEQVIPWLTAADVVVMPYTRLYQSAVITQASALGRPMIATRVGSFPELIEDGRTGWLVDPGDARALSGALLDALGDQARAERRGELARQDLVQRCSWGALAQRLLEVAE